MNSGSSTPLLHSATSKLFQTAYLTSKTAQLTGKITTEYLTITYICTHYS